MILARSMLALKADIVAFINSVWAAGISKKGGLTTSVYKYLPLADLQVKGP